jgi:hypothetical protein
MGVRRIVRVLYGGLAVATEIHILNRNLYTKYRLKTRVGRFGLINNRRRRDSKRRPIFRQADMVTNELRHPPNELRHTPTSYTTLMSIATSSTSYATHYLRYTVGVLCYFYKERIITSIVAQLI